ncbi:MAG: T9SS type A sorting domain-containing protein, partial [Saprospiraceae bacterium]
PNFNNRNFTIRKHPYEDQVFFNVNTSDGACLHVSNKRFTSWSNFKNVSGSYNTKKIMRGPGNKLYAFIGLGCMISHDQGNTWQTFHIENKGVVDLIFDPSGYTYAITANNRFYLLPPNAQTWRRYTPHNFGISRYQNTRIFRGKAGELVYSWNSGTYLSYDNGTNWSKIDPPLYKLDEKNLAFDNNGDFYIHTGGFLRRYYNQGNSYEILYETDSNVPLFIAEDGTKIFPRSKSDPGDDVSRMYLPGDTSYTMVNPVNYQIYLDTNKVGIYLGDDGLFYSTNYFDAPELLSDLDNINSFYLDKDYTLYLARKNGKIMRSKGSADIDRQILDVTAYWDKNGDCELDPGDEPIKNLTLSFDNGDRRIERTTDDNGKIWMEYGNCFIEKKDELNFWESCESVVYVNFSERFDTIQVDYLVKAEPACPYLSAGMGTPFFNSCDEATYWIGYDNTGIVKSENTRLEIRLDSRLEFVASQVPLIDLGNNLFELVIGDFEKDSKETFWLKVKTPWDTNLIGTAFCSEVEIFPNNNCLPIDKIEGPYLEAEAECLGDSVRFTITNTGERNMLESQEYYWMAIENYPEVHKSKPFKLRKNESLDFKIPAEGLTYRVEVNQPDGVYDKYTTVNIEGCGGSNISKGYFNAFGHQEGKLTYDLDCRILTSLEEPNGFSFQVEPEGAGSERKIPSNIDLEHEIILFNKGTTQLDSGLVFVEIITSTNQPIHFSNKPLPEGLKTNNLALQPYAVNPDESYLYIKFKPFTIPTLPAGNYLPHFAIQNISGSNDQFLLRIRGEYDILTSEKHPITNQNISIAPNPMKEQALINLEGADLIPGKLFQLELYNLNGQIVEAQNFLGTKFYLSRNGLPSGMYFFRISQEGRTLASGQIIMQ